MSQSFSDIVITGFDEERLERKGEGHYRVHLKLSAHPTPEWLEAFRASSKTVSVALNASTEGITFECSKQQLTVAQRYVDGAKHVVGCANRACHDRLLQEEYEKRAEEADKEVARRLLRQVQY